MAEPAKIVFKKYGKNRRLYNTSASRYVNLDELAALIREGTEVQVIDAQSGEDLTALTLTQIIMEDAREKPNGGLPLELLRQLIVASDHVGREFIMWYLRSAFDTYHKLQGALENGLSEVNQAARSPLQLVKNLIQGTVSPSSTPKSQAPETADGEELRKLRQRIAELEARLEKPKTSPRNRKPKSAKAASGPRA